MPQIISKEDYKGDPLAERIFRSPIENFAIWGLKHKDTGAIIGWMTATNDEIKDFHVNGFELIKRAEFIGRDES